MEITDKITEQLKTTFNHVDALLALRGIACLIVVFFHCSIPSQSIIYQKYDFSWVLLGDGQVAVGVFFCLSGYLMGKAFYTQRYEANVSGFTQFIINRALRIFPLYYFSVLILSIFVYPEIFQVENWGKLLRICTFTYTFPLPIISNLDTPFNPVLWSLSTEVQFYLIVPFIYTAFRYFLVTKKKIILTGSVIVLMGIFLRFAALITRPLHTALILNLDLFLMGFLINAWFQCNKKLIELNIVTISAKIRKRVNLKLISVCLLIIFYLVTSYHGYHAELWNVNPRPGLMGESIFRTMTSFFIWPTLTAILTTIFIYAFESSTVYNDYYKNRKLSLQTCLENPLRILEIMGVLSYGVYIWHLPIRDKVSPMFPSTTPLDTFYQRLLATLIISTILATVTYYIVELPASRQKKYSPIFSHQKEIFNSELSQTK
ncbi:MAG: acyltransferase family protein [Microcoleaceae cyanobacterium]|jgi:peptidoglycan/LPS O-acetylase OafA/YrhL